MSIFTFLYVRCICNAEHTCMSYFHGNEKMYLLRVPICNTFETFMNYCLLFNLITPFTFRRSESIFAILVRLCIGQVITVSLGRYITPTCNALHPNNRRRTFTHELPTVEPSTIRELSVIFRYWL